MAETSSDHPWHEPAEATSGTHPARRGRRRYVRSIAVVLLAAGVVGGATSGTRALSTPRASVEAVLAEVPVTDGSVGTEDAGDVDGANPTTPTAAAADGAEAASTTEPTDSTDSTDTAAVGDPVGMSPTAPRSAEAGWRTEATLDAFQAQVAALDAATTGTASVYALNLDTGAAASYDPVTAFVTASIVKVDLVAALLLRAQDAGRELTASERSLATAAITVSSNDAATSIYQAIGGASGLASANALLGLTETTPRSSWGLTTTSAADQVRLLTALTSEDSPLTAPSRAYLLGLMSEVCDDQDWGVTAAGDDDAPVKNGWLPYSGDGYAWEVNSIGIVTVGSQRVLIAVLTRHGATEASGIALVEQLSRLAAAAVT